MANKSAREQFREDVMLVLDNDEKAYTSIMKYARSIRDKEWAVPTLADYMAGMYEDAITGAINERNELGALLIRQVCLNWGSDAFLNMARDIFYELDLQEQQKASV
jgi:hypothetical protein